MSNLKGTIESLASTFAANIITALRTASIDELAEFTGGRRATMAAVRGGSSGGSASSAAEPSAASGKRGARPAARKGGRLGRRSAADIASMIDQIVSVVAKAPSGLRAEQIRSALGVESKELPRPLADAVSAGRLTKTGQKRATTYFAGGGSAKRGGKKR